MGIKESNRGETKYYVCFPLYAKPVFKYAYTHIRIYDMKTEDNIWEREGANDMREGGWVADRNKVWVR